jgi:hypothetical protein
MGTRSTGSLQASGSTIITAKPGSKSGTQLALKPSSGGRTIYQEMDQAYSSGANSTMTPADLSALKARLSSVINSKSSGERRRRPPELSSTASTAVPGGFRGGAGGKDAKQSSLVQSKGDLLAGMDTPLTSRTEESDFVQDNAFNIVNDIVDTCVELEHASMILSKSETKLGRSALPSTLPSAIWTARAALACAASAEAASAAAEVAAAASAEAAREAAKCAAAAKAATGRYNHLVDYVMSARGETTMRPGGMPALEGSGADSKQRKGSQDSVESAGGEESEDDEGKAEQQQLEKESAREVKPLTMPLDVPVNLSEFKLAASSMDIDDDEAKNIFESLCEEAKKPVDEALTFPLEEYLEELKIDCNDHDGVQHFMNALQKAKDQLASAPGAAPKPAQSQKSTQRQMFNKVVRHMDIEKVTAKDAWKYVSARMEATKADVTKQFLSKAEAAIAKSFEGRERKFVQTVSDYMVQPPTLCASAGQTSAKEICIRQVDEIIKKCKESGTQFTDPDWDMHSFPEKVLYVDSQSPGFDCTVAPPESFKRLTTIVKKSCAGGTQGAISSMFGSVGKPAGGHKKGTKPLVFKGEVKAGDIVQGQIGTCFLLGAIGAMACHREKAIHKIFMRYDVDVGVYGIRFCVDGEWAHVIVDDWFPVDSYGEMIYARSKDPQEVWVPLLEKAFCKLHTCYEMCDGGQSTEALNCFFGGVGGKLEITKHHRHRPSDFFKLLKNACDKGWLLTTSFVMQPGAKAGGSGKCGEDMLPCGLVGGHAYSVLKICEANGNQLIQCRNPWGTGEWTGTWSDGDTESWTAEMKAAAGAAGVDDGKFWMSAEDFVNNSGGVDYARTFGPNWKKSTQYAHFAACALMGTAKRDWKGKGPGQLSFKKGDQVRIKEMQGDLFQGHLKGQERTLGIFPGRCLKINERPVLRFDIVATPDAGSKDPVTAVILLMQRNIAIQRKYTKSEQTGGMNYKDLNYAQIELFIVNPDGKVAVRKQNRKRCIWGEIEMPGGGQWRVYALSNAGKASPAIVRTYLKGGSLTFKEVPGTKFAEVAPFFLNDK